MEIVYGVSRNFSNMVVCRFKNIIVLGRKLVFDEGLSTKIVPLLEYCLGISQKEGDQASVQLVSYTHHKNQKLFGTTSVGF